MITLSDLHGLVALGESTTLEFKKSTAEKDRACRTLCGFANGQGGVLVFGLSPDGQILGQQVSDRTLEELARFFEGFEPPLFPRIERLAVDDEKTVLVVRVDTASMGPVVFRGVPYERVLNTTRVMTRSRYQQLLIENLHATERWENKPASDWNISMLDTREMVLTLEEAIRRGRSEDPGTRDPMEILRGLGLLVKGNELSQAAIVLFCREEIPLSDFPQLLLRVARFKGCNRDEFYDNRRFQGNAFSLMRKAERFLMESLPIAGRVIPGRMEREDRPLLPIEALREALANAFVHRDYSVGGGSVGVAIYEDRLEISSTGQLHFGVTPESLLQPHESKPWNPMVASVFYRRGIIETWGRGIQKIARLMEEADREFPVSRLWMVLLLLHFHCRLKPQVVPSSPQVWRGSPQVWRTFWSN